MTKSNAQNFYSLFGKAMRRIAAGWLLISAFISISFSAFAQQEGVSINSFRILKTTPDYVEIELVGSNNGTIADLWLGVIAKSRDGTVRPTGFRPYSIPADKPFKILSHVQRPYGLAAQKTDVLMMMIYPRGKGVIQRHTFDWPHVWPIKAANPNSKAEEFKDLSTAKPWLILLENLEEEEFGVLDEVINKWNNPRERDKNGEWKLDSFRSVFFSYVPRKRNWKHDLKRINKWRKFNPKSAGAAIAESKYWISYARNIRGSDTQTDPFALRIFGERMQRAEQVLTDAKDYSSDNPLWYEAYLEAAVTLKRDHEFIEALYKEAIHRHPYFQPLYLKMAAYWAPRSGYQADWRKADEVVRQAAENTATIDGETNYAMLYVQLSESQRRENLLFDAGYLSWNRMRNSFEEWVKRYPSMDNLNTFAAFACRANDKKAFFNIRPRIINRILPGKWLDAYSYDLCNQRFMQKV